MYHNTVYEKFVGKNNNSEKPITVRPSPNISYVSLHEKRRFIIISLILQGNDCNIEFSWAVWSSVVLREANVPVLPELRAQNFPPWTVVQRRTTRSIAALEKHWKFPVSRSGNTATRKKYYQLDETYIMINAVEFFYRWWNFRSYCHDFAVPLFIIFIRIFGFMSFNSRFRGQKKF